MVKLTLLKTPTGLIAVPSKSKLAKSKVFKSSGTIDTKKDKALTQKEIQEINQKTQKKQQEITEKISLEPTNQKPTLKTIRNMGLGNIITTKTGQTLYTTTKGQKFDTLEKAKQAQTKININNPRLTKEYKNQLKQQQALEQIQKINQITTDQQNLLNKYKYLGELEKQKKTEKALKELDKINKITFQTQNILNTYKYLGELEKDKVPQEFFNQQKEFMTKNEDTKNIDFKQINQKFKPIIKQPNPNQTFFRTKESLKQDISQEEYEKQLKELQKTNILTDITIPKIKERIQTGQKKFGILGKTKGTAYKEGLTIFNNPLTEGIRTGYNIASDIAGTIIAGGGRTTLIGSGFGLKIDADSKVKELKSKGLINPKETTIQTIKTTLPQQLESDFYTGKLAGETGSLLIGGGIIQTVSLIGQTSRAEKPEEFIAPLTLGALGRLGAGKIGDFFSKTIGKTNTKIEQTAQKILTRNKPVPENVLATNKITNALTEQKVGKALLTGGATLELGGLQLTPQEQKEEYIRQVGLFNVGTPVGYRLTDVGLALKEFAKVKILAPISKTPIFKAKDLMTERTYKKFSKTGGGTPIARVSEPELISGLQKDTKFSKVGTVAEKFGVDLKQYKSGAAFRSVDVKLPDLVEPRLGNYEARQDFFSTELHPIGLQGVGIKNRLLKPLTGARDRLRLTNPNPEIEFTIAPKGTAIQFKKDTFTYQDYLNLKKIYGYKPQEKYLDLGAQGKKIGKKRIDISKTLTQQEFDKITSGGRPFKNRDIKALIGEEAFNANFIEQGEYPTKKLGGFFSSQSRSIGKTTETEVLLDTARQKVKPTNIIIKEFNFLGKKRFITSEGIKKRFGLADAYVDVGLEVVPINIRKTITPKTTSLTVADKKILNDFTPKLETKQKRIGETKKLIESKKISLLESKKLVKKTRVNIEPKKISKSGYSGELQERFGKRFLGERIKNPFISTQKSISKPVSQRELNLNRSILTRPSQKRDLIKRKELSRPLTKRDILTRPQPNRTPPRRPDRRLIDIPRPTPTRTPPRRPDRRLIDTPRPTPTRTPPRTPSLIVNPPSRPISEIKSFGFGVGKENPAYNVYVRQSINGKNVKPQLVGKKLPKNTAINKGTQIASEYTQRTVQLKQVGTTQTPDEPLNKTRLQQYRQLVPKTKIKRKNINFVEKSKYAIDSRNEKLGIPYKAQKQRKRGIFL